MLFQHQTRASGFLFLSFWAALLPLASAFAETTRYAYDDSGRTIRVWIGTQRSAEYTYDASGRHIRTLRQLDPLEGKSQALITHEKHDPAGRLIAVAHVVETQGELPRVVAGQRLSRLPGGAIYRIETFRAGTYDAESGMFAGIPETRDFRHDANARLVRETWTRAGEVVDQAYEYDAVGNRILKTLITAAGVEVTHYTYSAADRLVLESIQLPAGGSRAITYGWGGNGNLASKTEPGRVTLYRFDPQNRLIDIRVGATLQQAQAAAPVVRYAYDAQGNRVRKHATVGKTYVIDPSWEFPQLVLENRADVQILYVRGRRLEWQTRYGGPMPEHLFPLYGHLGTSLGAVDAQGHVVERVDVSAFGSLESGGTPIQAHLFTGEYWDHDAQLLYLRARWYDPRTGRFISADPFEGMQSEPRSLNRYVYAQQDPVHRADPGGYMSMIEVTSGLNIQSIAKAYNVASFAVDLYSGGLAGGARAVAEEIVFGKLSRFKPISRINDQVIGMFSKIWERGIRLRLGHSYSSGHLKHNLEQLFGPLPANHAAHHIVPSTSPAMKRLQRFGIDPNSPSNGVALPQNKDLGISAQHSGRHCSQYYDFIERLILGAHDKTDVVNALALIRQELLSGAIVVQHCT